MSREFIREDYLRVEIIFKPVLPAREIAIAWLAELEFEVFESTDTGLIVYAPKKIISIEELTKVRLRLEEIASVVWNESIVKTENWNAQWEANYETVNVEGMVIVRAPFHDQPLSGLDVIIAPHMSFGTGHHATTWLMIKSLLDIDVLGKSVLDMGCGTGVLALTAMKMGASKVLAIDIEEGAYKNTLENAKLNHFEGEKVLNVICGDASSLKSGKSYDVILANINRNILLADISTYNRVLKEEGIVALSGFFTGDVEILREEIDKLNWKVVKVLEKEGWACIICVKTPQ
ncbi:MAG: 50S ribosomal protein L11 methyltransferase [Bacteroidetes bacterium]|nr:MAG: 50S ribosomal protein L11 methyltransferase [Bacteroidota bacterium]